MEGRWENKVVKELLSKERFDKESWEMEAWMSMWDLRREIRRFEGKYDYCYCPIVKMNEDRKLYRRMHMMLRNPNQVGERLRAEKAAVIIQAFLRTTLVRVKLGWTIRGGCTSGPRGGPNGNMASCLGS